jgi:hypothetical protein
MTANCFHPMSRLGGDNGTRKGLPTDAVCSSERKMLSFSVLTLTVVDFRWRLFPIVGQTATQVVQNGASL